MIVADTSVWIAHLSRVDQDLVELMQKEIAVMHGFVLLELSCGNFKNRNRTMGELKLLPFIDPVDLTETSNFIEKYSLYGLGLGLVDMNILATCKKNNFYVYTHDLALKRQAQRLGLFSFRS